MCNVGKLTIPLGFDDENLLDFMVCIWRNKNRRVQKNHPKYFMGDYFMTCWYCGYGGHIKKNCMKRQAQAEKQSAYININNQHTSKSHRNKKPYPRTNSNDVNLLEYYVASPREQQKFFYQNRPGKAKLARAIKT